MTGRTILSLCDHSGVWSQPYADHGYDVVRIDLQAGQDVRLVKWPGRVHGVLAAPPCTVFSRAGARWERSDEDMIAALSVVDACLRFVAVCRPVWWCLENPAGMLKRYLGPPTGYFDPADFGDPWTKKTALWGNFAMPVPDGLFVSTRSVAPQGSKIHLLPGVAPSDSAAVAQRKRNDRSRTPAGFAKAFFECNS